MFCPENQLIKADLSCHSEISSSAKLQVLKLENYSDFMSIDLITSAQRNLPTYVTDFCSMIRTYYQDQIQRYVLSIYPGPIINTTLRSLCTDNPVCMTCHGHLLPSV